MCREAVVNQVTTGKKEKERTTTAAAAAAAAAAAGNENEGFLGKNQPNKEQLPTLPYLETKCTFLPKAATGLLISALKRFIIHFHA